MMTPGIRVDREALSAAVAAFALADGPVLLAEHIRAFRAPGPLRLSGAFLRLWCGQDGPTEALDAWLLERGLEIAPADSGWDVRREVARVEQGGLFG